jgi:hypothetical protein
MVYLAMLAALRMESGILFQVLSGRKAVALRQEVINAMLVGLPAVSYSATDEVVAGQAAEESLRIAKELFASNIYKAHSLATFIFSCLATQSNVSLEFLI